MAGPIFNSVGTRSTSAGATSRAPAKPSAASANGLMLCVVTTKNNETHSTATAGWALLSQVNSGAGFTASLWHAKGDAVAPTFTWTSSVACSAQISYYDDPANVVDVVLGATTSNSGTTSTHSTSSVNTTRSNSLVVYADVAAANTALATPSGWTEDVDAGSATDAGRSTWGSKAVASSGSASGAISVTGANAAWVQWQVEVMGEAAPAGFQVSEVEVGAWEDVSPGFSASEVEVGAWLDRPNEFSVSEVEVGAWLDFTGLPAAARRRQASVVN